jgi:RNA polymerase sigma factor (sigma-70 family)
MSSGSADAATVPGSNVCPANVFEAGLWPRAEFRRYGNAFSLLDCWNRASARERSSRSEVVNANGMNPQEIFLSNIALIERITAFVCRTNRLNSTASEDFASEVKLALIVNDYDIIRKFEGRSTFSTYLTTVIQRLFYQQRVKEWGKWRPSAEAKRMGEKAVTLERLLTRDGFSFAEARQFLTAGNGPGYDPAELEAMHLRLPARQARPKLVEQDSEVEGIADEHRTDAALLHLERERTARLAAGVIDEAIGKLESEDQLILRLRFWHAWTAPKIASRLPMEQKKVYKRIEKLMSTMRRALERAGVARSDIDDLLSDGDHDLQFSALSSGKAESCPSDQTDGIGGAENRRTE